MNLENRLKKLAKQGYETVTITQVLNWIHQDKMDRKAKQIAEKALLIIVGGKVYTFTTDEFKEFCDQLCKEQRENVLKVCNFDSDYTYYFAKQDEILNAKQPEV